MIDCDGIGAVSILLKVFKKLNYPVEFYQPSRLKEGYGISKKGIDRMKAMGTDLIISVDCGITAKGEVEYAKILGIDCIISDHHHVFLDTVPDAVAVINPHHPDCEYPFKYLAGCGVAFKIAQALIPDLLEHDDISEFMNIVAFSSIADIVSMTDENRIFGHFGMMDMGTSSNIGMRALSEVSGVTESKVNSGTVGFQLSPRVNACGRIGKPEIGVNLFMSENKIKATKIAEELDELNTERKEIEKSITQQCIDIIEDDESYQKDKFLILSGKGWQTGIIGVCASKVGEKYHKPIFILSEGEDSIAKGSGRSIGGFDLLESLQSTSECLQGFGGHSAACGISLPIENIPLLRKQINLYADSVLTLEDMIPKIKYECELSLEDLNFDLIKELDYLQPTGVGNPQCVFLVDNLTITDKRLLGKNKEHLKIVLSQGEYSVDALQFNSDIQVEVGQKVKALVTLNLNDFRGKTIQFFIKDLKVLDN